MWTAEAAIFALSIPMRGNEDYTANSQGDGMGTVIDPHEG